MGDITSAPGYGSSKAGGDALMKTLARQLAPYGIRVNAVAPHAIETEMSAQWPEEKGGRSSPPFPSAGSGSPRMWPRPSSFWPRRAPRSSRGRSSMSTGERSWIDPRVVHPHGMKRSSGRSYLFHYVFKMALIQGQLVSFRVANLIAAISAKPNSAYVVAESRVFLYHFKLFFIDTLMRFSYIQSERNREAIRKNHFRSAAEI